MNGGNCVKERYLVTGNEAVSLPTIRESDGGLEGISILYMAAKGMLEIVGSPLMAPFVEIDNEAILLTDFSWEWTRYWIPSFTARAGGVRVEGVILAPVGERGFCYRLKVVNQDFKEHQVRYGLKGCWDKTLHSINESKLVDGERHAYGSGWNHAFVMDMRVGVSLFALAPIYTEQPEISHTRCEYNPEQDGAVSYCFWRNETLEPGGEDAENFWFGVGFEEVAASTSAKEMLRQGFDKEYEKTCRWLAARERSAGDPKLDELLNRNMFFSFFFGSGVTLDTEELVLVTSRSPRYYVSAAYWDRDSLLWSFPAILMTDPDYAREMLGYVFGRQGRNVGIHSRFIDGTVLEPGFELDELCAPVLALAGYVRETGDRTVLAQPDIASGVEHILRLLAEKKSAEPGVLRVSTEKNLYQCLNLQIKSDLFVSTTEGVTLFEAKAGGSKAEDLYQLRMYHDGCVADDMEVREAVLIAQRHPDTVKALLTELNRQKDKKGRLYHFALTTWDEEGIALPPDAA